MFAKTIIDSDAFLDMALSTQALYFHLSMRADDDGFINNPKKLCRMIGSSDDEMKILFAKKFILGFESGVIVIKHWKMHNYIQKDRYKETNYLEEKSQLREKENKVYTLGTECIQDGNTGKDRLELGEVSIEVEIEEEKPKKIIKKSLSQQIEDKLSEYNNINLEAFNEWVDHKKYKSIAPITKLLNMLTKYDYYVQQEMVDNSIMNNYAGIFEPKGKPQQKQTYAPVNGMTASQIRDALAEEAERGLQNAINQ